MRRIARFLSAILILVASTSTSTSQQNVPHSTNSGEASLRLTAARKLLVSMNFDESLRNLFDTAFSEFKTGLKKQYPSNQSEIDQVFKNNIPQMDVLVERVAGLYADSFSL